MDKECRLKGTPARPFAGASAIHRHICSRPNDDGLPMDDRSSTVNRTHDVSGSCLRILIAAGGTGGHIFPALAVAQELQSRRAMRGAGLCSIEFVGTGRGLESRVIPAAGFALHVVAAAGLKGMGRMATFRNLLVLPRTFWQSGMLLYRFRPHVVVGLGGYVAGPVMLEAALARIPTILIEPNASPGFTNRALAPWIRFAALGFDSAARFYGTKARVTGHPVREAFSRVAPKVHASPFTILILGGSQGSSALNGVVVQAIPLLASRLPGLRIIHQTGERDFDRVQAAYAASGLISEVYKFIDKMPETLGRADLVVCRAGASTVAELAAAGKASILVPFPAAADDHQSANARVLESAGSARMIEQHRLSPAELVENICALLAQPDTLAKMEQNVRAFSRPDSAARIANLIESVARMAPS